MNNPKNSTSPDPMTRRDFLKTTSTAAVGASVLGGLAVDRSAYAAAGDTLKIALVGCGGRGTGAASQALSVKENVQLVAMADAFRDRLDGSHNELMRQADLKKRINVSDDNKFVGFDAYKQAIPLADVVLLATPPGFRPIHFEEAVRQGKHVFTEKPVAVDAPGVRRFLAAAEEAKKKNLKVGVGLQRHHQLGYLETIKRLHDGAIGDITSMRAYWNDAGVWVRPRQPSQTEMEYQMRNWYYFVWLGGDHIVEQHIHNLDVINWIKKGHPVRGQGQGGREVRKGIDNGQIFDHHFVEFEYADGSRLLSQCRHIGGCWSQVAENVVGTKGTCEVNRYIIRGEGGNWRHNGRDDKNPYQVEHDDFFQAILDDKPYNEGEYGAISSMTSIFGRMCTYSGKMLEWDDAIKSDIDLSPKAYAFDARPPIVPDANGRYPVAVPGKDIHWWTSDQV